MKVLVCADLHINPKWIEKSRAGIDRIIQVAKDEAVSCIVVSGDMFHRALVASDSQSWTDINKMAADMRAVCPVLYIHGTPSHDSPGAYTGMGFQELTIGKSQVIDGLLIMGLPEITPVFIMSQHPELSKMEAVEKQYALVDMVIDNYYAPTRGAHDGPCLFALHGHVSGAKFKDDQAPRSSEFMFRESTLNRIGADWYTAGHLHLPQSFQTIPGGYTGSLHMTWGDTGFVPGFNVLEFDESGLVDQKRFDYGIPHREKITVTEISDIPDFNNPAQNALYSGADLWIEIKCDKAFAEQFGAEASLEEIRQKISLGPNSKITLNIQREEHTRIDTDEYEKIQTLEDLVKIYNPEVSKSALLKVREAETATGLDRAAEVSHEFGFMDISLRGAKFLTENGVEEISLTEEDFQTGTNLLTGPNGIGKSFLLGFCTPYSMHLPRGLDIKPLFDLKDSQITRRFRDGNNVITQKIVIDPTLASPTAKYYMDIDGTPVDGVTGNKKPFDEAVERIFGPVNMFMACVFRGQKSNKDYPDLMDAKEADLRQIFTELSGLDRTPIKEYAQQKAKEINRDIELDEREIDTLTGTLEDEPTLINQQFEFEGGIKKTEIELSDVNKSIETIDAQLSTHEQTRKQNAQVVSDIQNAERERDSATEALSGYRSTFASLEAKIVDTGATEAQLMEYRANDSTKQKKQAQLDSLGQEYNETVKAWKPADDALNEELEGIKEKADKYKITVDAANFDISKIEAEIRIAENNINSLNKPCEHCGKLSSSSTEQIAGFEKEIRMNQNRISVNRADIQKYEDDLESLRAQYREKQAQKQPYPVEPVAIVRLREEIKKIPVTPYGEIDRLEKLISAQGEIKQQIAELRIKVESEEKAIGRLTAQIVDLNKRLIPADKEGLDRLNFERGKAAMTRRDLESRITDYQSQVKAIQHRIEKSQQTEVVIEEKREAISQKITDRTEWQDIAAAFAPKGIPAMELSLIAPQIDKEANALLRSYSDRFQVETITQDLNSTGKELIERFKILVHDSQGSEPKSLTVVSGGQGVWVLEAMRGAIAKVYGQRTGRTWKYMVLDEADAALDTEKIVAFYEMIALASEDKTVFAVTHSTEAKSMVQNQIDMEEVMRV